MKIRSTVILFGLFAAALLTFAAFQWLGIQTGDESKHAERFVFPSLNPYNPKNVSLDQPVDPMTQKKPKGPQQAQPEEFTRLVIERNRNDSKKTERIEFNRVTIGKTPKWMLMIPLKVRTDDAAVTNLIRSLITLEKQKSREAGRDLSKLGLDHPEVLVTLTRGDKEYTLSLGSTGPATKDPIYFAASSEWAGKPFLLTKSKIEKLFDDLANFRDKTLISSSFGQVGVKVGGTARSAMELSKDKDWSFKEPALGEADTPATDEYIRQLAGIRIERNEDFVADNADAARLAQYGVTADKPLYSFTLTQSPIDPKDKPIVEQVLVGNADDSAARQAAQVRTASLILESAFSPTTALASYVAREQQKVEPAYYYARLANDTSIVRIPARHLPLLKKTADELRIKALAKVDNSKVDAVTIKTGGETLRIYRPDLQGAASWDLYSDNRASVKCQPTAIQTLLDALTKIEIRDSKAFLDDDVRIRTWFGDATIDLGLDKPQAEVTLWLEGIHRDSTGKVSGSKEPKIKDELITKPAYKLAIGRKDEKRRVTYVRREVPGCKPVILAVPDPFIAGDAAAGAMQAGAVPPDGRQTFSISSLAANGYLAYRDRTLPSYRVDQISSVEVKRPGVSYLMERTESSNDRGNLVEAWKLKQPVEGTPNLGVPDFVTSTLIGTSSEKLVTDRATEKDLDEAFGLVKSPLLQVVVKTKAVPAKSADANSKVAQKEQPAGTYTYTIGRKLADNSRFPNHYYARMEARLADGTAPDSNQFVLAVPLSYVQSLDVELRSTTIYPEETTKPVNMQVTWHAEGKDKKQVVTSLDLAMDNDKWAVTRLTENGTDARAQLAKLDQGKINALLRYGPQPAPGGPSMNPWMVDRFIQHGGNIDGKYQLDPAKSDTPPRLLIQVKYTDGKSRMVILGKSFKPTESEMPVWGGSTFFYAASPAVPGAVMLVNEATWRELISGISYFSEKTPAPKQ